MDSPDLTVYVDTNCFIELRDLQDLPWKEIAPTVRRIEIAVPRSVITELDKMKTDRSSDRRRNRSRKALALIATAIEEVDERITLKNSTVDLSLRICRGSNLPWGEYPDLDRDSVDDRIVLCAVSENIQGNKLLLSVDTGPYLSAKDMQLKAARPPESWHITADDSAETQELTKLRRQLAEAKATKPEIDIDFLREGESVNVFDFTSLLVPPLLRRVQESLLGEIHDLNYEESIKDETFTIRVGKFLEQLHQAVYDASSTNAIAIRLNNRSSVTAHNLLSVVRVEDGLTVIDDDSDFELFQRQLWLPKPERPQPRHGLSHPTLPALPPQSVEKPRDPTQFYWQVRPRSHSTFASSICMEFRARQEYTDRFLISPYSREIVSGSIDVELSATNLPGPLRRTAGLRLTEKKSSWSDEEVQKLLPDYIAKRLLNF